MGNRWGWVLIVVAAAVQSGAGVRAEEPKPRRKLMQRAPAPVQAPGDRKAFRARAVRVNEAQGKMAVPFSLARDGDAEQWLKKAAGAADRGEWKLAVDSLWRVVDRYGYAIVEAPTGGMMAAPEAAWALLRSWPHEGLATFQTIYEPEARQLLAEAERSGDVEGLRRVAAKYLPTRSGQRALDVLAIWSLDMGRPYEAAAALSRLLSLSDSEETRARLQPRLAVAEAAAGRTRAALEHLTALRPTTQVVEGADWEGRDSKSLAALEAFIRAGRTFSHESRGGESAWSGLLGGGRRGQMPAVEPTLNIESPWRRALPGCGGLSETELARASARYSVGPSWQMAVDASHLFVRCVRGVVALDPQTFEVLWEGSVRPEDRSGGSGGRAGVIISRRGTEEAANAETMDGRSLRVLGDELRGSIGLADGKVFVIEPPREYDEGAAVMGQLGVRPFAMIETDADELIENTLYAFEAETGKLAWLKGAGGPASDGLLGAHFFATPVVCGDILVAPYASGDDFALAVLRGDGTLVRKIVLGSAPSSSYPRRSVLAPALSEPLMFVPTGAGTILALDTDSLSLRWTAVYPRDTETNAPQVLAQVGPRGTRMPVTSGIPAGWASNPPVAVKDLVVIAAPDSSRLFALDRDTGERRWAVSSDGNRYVVGCDDEQVYLAGHTVQANRLSDGKRVWCCKDWQPSGRPVLAGDRILVPTLQGLATLDARSGTVLHAPPSAADEDLAGLLGRGLYGNLLAWNESVYNVTATHVNRLVDLERSIASARRRLERHPDDRRWLLRLALLESLRGNTREMLALLERARRRAETGSEDLARVDEQVAHLWVEGQLDLAAEATGRERLQLIEAAVDAARRPVDVLRAYLALMQHEAESGETRRAFETGLTAYDRVGTAVVELDSPLSGYAWLAISERMERIWRSMNATRQEKLASAVWSARVEGHSVTEIERLADLLGFGTLGARLHLESGRPMEANGAIESAEYHYRRALVLSADARSLGAEAVARLIRLHAAPAVDLPARPELAAGEIRQMQGEFADERFPDPDSGGRMVNGRDFAQRWRSRLPVEQRDALSGKPSPREVGDWHLLDVRSNLPLGVFATRIGPMGTGSMALLEIGGQVVALNTAADQPRTYAWTFELSRDSSLMQELLSQFWVNSRQSPNQADGALEGGCAMVRASGVYYPLGWTTGRLLGPPLIPRPEEFASPRPRVAASDGFFVAAIDSRTLVGLPAREGTKPIWRRELPELLVDRLEAAGRYVVALSDRTGQAVSLRPCSGRIQAQISSAAEVDGVYALSEKDGKRVANQMTIVGTTLCRSGERSVMGWDVGSGRVLWRHEVEGNVVGLTALNDETVGISFGSGCFRVVDVRTGARVCEVKPENAVLPPQAANLEEGRLILFVRTEGDSNLSRLEAYDATSGSALWSRGPLQRAMVTAEMLRDDRDVAAVVETLDSEPALEIAPRTQVLVRAGADVYSRILLVDKHSGGRLGQPIVLRTDRMMSDARVNDVLTNRERIVVATSAGYYLVGRGASQVESPQDAGSEEAEEP